MDRHRVHRGRPGGVSLGVVVVTAKKITKKFKLTKKQFAAMKLLASAAIHIMLYGGSRSGKTFLILRTIVIRALMFPESRHAVFRLRFNHVKASIVLDTFPKMMQLCFPGVRYHLNKSDWYVELPNKSQVWFGGLDEKDRTEKILGQEYATIYLVEISQLSYSARNIALTRLAQKCSTVIDGELKTLRLKMYYDCNPPPKSHWAYKLFKLFVDPQENKKLADKAKYASMLMNPKDNLDNLDPEYLNILDNLPASMRKRFLLGQFLDKVEGALWSPEVIDRNRVPEYDTANLRRVVVAVDPPGSSEDGGTEAGIVAAGLEIHGDRTKPSHAYVLADVSKKAKPNDWAKAAIDLYHELRADCIVAEKNFGGEMVEATINNVDPNVPVRLVHASRGKRRRAEPVSALYEKDRVSHIGMFPELEDELCTFVEDISNFSPNRLDAMVWALTELMGIAPVDVTDFKVQGKRLASADKPWAGAADAGGGVQAVVAKQLKSAVKPW